MLRAVSTIPITILGVQGNYEIKKRKVKHKLRVHSDTHTCTSHTCISRSIQRDAGKLREHAPTAFFQMPKLKKDVVYLMEKPSEKIKLAPLEGSREDIQKPEEILHLQTRLFFHSARLKFFVRKEGTSC